MMSRNPSPTPGSEEVTPRLIRELRERAEGGRLKYGHPLQTHNGRSALLDAWEESIDMAQYLTQAVMEEEDWIRAADPSAAHEWRVMVDDRTYQVLLLRKPATSPADAEAQVFAATRDSPQARADFAAIARTLNAALPRARRLLSEEVSSE